MNRAWPVLLLLRLLLLWPLPAVLGTEVLAARDQEAATHLWGLWAALHEGQPLVLRTTLLAFPAGLQVVLVDPANLPAYALGSLLGPVAGYNMVLYCGLVLCGLAGALLARETGGLPWLGAVAGMACPTVLANAADGMTEGYAVGWVGVQLALLLGAARQGGAGRVLGAAAALAATWYGGPYNGLFAALLDTGVGLGLLLRSEQRAVVLRRLVGVAVAAVLLASPLAYAVLRLRTGDLPGMAERAGLPRVVENPAIFRGGVQTGADLLDLALPGPLTGGEAPISHTAYLGVVALGLAVAAVVRDRRRWPWLAGAALYAGLALGPYLYLGGEVLRLGGRPLLGPAGLATLAWPLLGRITRWYRAGAVASLLLAPLIATWGSTRRRAVGLAAALVVDALLLAPLAWPLHHNPPPEVAPYLQLEGEGAIFEMPRTTTAEPPPGAWRDRTALVQAFHGRPLAGTIMNLQDPPGVLRHHRAMLQLVRTGELPAGDRARLVGDGFRWLAWVSTYLPLTETMRANLERCLGPPVARGRETTIYALDRAEAGCLPPQSPVPVQRRASGAD